MAEIRTYRVASPGATQGSGESSWSHVLVFRTVPSAHTLVRWVDENAFAPIVRARPCPTFGRPVRHWDCSHRLRPGTSPHALRIPSRDGHPALRSAASGGCRSALAVSGFHLRARVGFSIPSTLPGQRGITPAFGYGAPHPGAGGTQTLLTNTLSSAHCGPLRHPAAPPPTVTSRVATPRSAGPPTLRKGPSLRAAPTTPVGCPRCTCRLLPREHCGLPRVRDGSAPTSSLSRPAQDSLALRPADSLGSRTEPVVPEASAYTARVATEMNRLLLGWISHPLVLCAFVAHSNVLGAQRPAEPVRWSAGLARALSLPDFGDG